MTIKSRIIAPEVKMETHSMVHLRIAVAQAKADLAAASAARDWSGTQLALRRLERAMRALAAAAAA